MTQLALAKMVIDALLVAAIVYLAIRTIRGNQLMPGANASGAAARELRDLELSLKTLLRDADVSSQGLTSTLSRQQRHLEQLLSEITSSETRISETIDAASRAATRIRAERSSMQSLPTNAALRGRAAVEVATQVDDSFTAEQDAEDEIIGPARPTQRPAPNRDTASKPQPRAAAQERKPAVALNVFGERIGSASSPQSVQAPQRSVAFSMSETDIAAELPAEPQAPTPARPTPSAKTKAPIYRQQRLAQQVEVERAVASVSAARESIESITSDEALDSEFTTEELPVMSHSKSRQEIHLSDLADQSDASEAAEQSAPRVVQQDPRLGVLGSVRRHTQVL